MATLQVLPAPTNQPTLNPKVQSAPITPTLAPKVVTQPVQPTLSPRVVTQPRQPTLSPQVVTQTPQAQINVDNSPRFARLGQAVKAKYPGVYDNYDDGAIGKIVAAKYPGVYDSLIDNGDLSASTGEETSNLSGFIKNIGTSGAGVVKNFLTAVLHPINTIEGVAKILGGATVTTFTLGKKSTPEFDGLITFLKDRYGSVDNIKKTAYEDPVGFLIDLSTVFDAGGSVLAKAGDVSKISEISKAGEIASKAGEVTNPVNAAAKVAKYGLSKTGNVTSEVLGFGTGAGGGAVKEAFNNPSEGFYQGLRGKASPESIVDEAKQALGAAKSNRATTYQKQLAEIKNAPTKLDLSPLKAELSKQLTKFGVELDDKGKLIFENSTISDAADKGKIQQAFDDINRWERNQQNLTPAGIDTLKRRIDNLYSPTSDVRAFTTALKSKARDILKKDVPGYEEMTKGYHEASSFIDDVTKGLSLSDRASTDTALRKLASALKQNNEFRTELVKQLEEIGGKDLTGKIAGYNLSAALPRGLFGKLVEGSTLLAAFKGLASLMSPATLAALATTSPRLVGEVVGALGVGTQKATEIVNYLQRSHAGRTLRIGAKAGYYEQKSSDSGKAGLQRSKR